MIYLKEYVTINKTAKIILFEKINRGSVWRFDVVNRILIMMLLFLPRWNLPMFDIGLDLNHTVKLN